MQISDTPEKATGVTHFSYPWYYIETSKHDSNNYKHIATYSKESDLDAIELAEGWVYGGTLLKAIPQKHSYLHGIFQIKDTATKTSLTLRPDQTFTFRMKDKGFICGRYYMEGNHKLKLYELKPKEQRYFPGMNPFYPDLNESGYDPIYDSAYKNGFSTEYIFGKLDDVVQAYGPEITIPIQGMNNKIILSNAKRTGSKSAGYFIEE